MSPVVVHSTRIHYLWLRDERRTPLGCIAYRLLSYPGEPLSLPVRWGWSILNLGLTWSEKTDLLLYGGRRDQFDRRLGRTIAEGRLNDFNPRVAASVSDIFSQIREEVDQFPLRIRLAAGRAYVGATIHEQRRHLGSDGRYLHGTPVGANEQVR